MALFQALGRQISGAWGKLSPGHRFILILLLVLCGGALFGVVHWAGKPDFGILCTGLTTEECSELTASLKDAGIPARVASGGSAVMVASGEMDEARMVAAEKGVPSAGKMGFEAFREPKIGMTPFAERVNYINALQNELATTITSLDPVVYARVHLVMPQRELFARDRKQASGSVLVVTRGDRALDARHASAIANLVASAVEGLSPEDVTITDGRGNVLSGGEDGGPEVAADEQLAYRLKVEQYLSEKAESMLARVLGSGRCEVRVGAEMDFEDSRETTRQYDPENRAVVSERIESTKSSGGGRAVGGPVGSAANVPGEEQAAGPTGGTASTSETENIDTQYVVSESVREKVNKGATVKRLTVAAFVDLTPGEDADGGEGGEATGAGQQTAVPALEDVSRVIKEAIGFDETRGDTLKVVQADFHPVTSELADVGRGLPQWAVRAGEYFAIGVLGIVLLILGRRAVKGIEAAAPRRVVIPEVVEGEGTGGPPMQVNEDEIIRREVARFVAENPEMAGRMIEGWVEGEE